MRIVAGRYRGKRLFAPSDDTVRPTTDRIKETLFNILQHDVPDAAVLDLFCGSGALGIECLSRGAKEVVFVDKHRDSVALTNENLKGIEGNYKVITGDFLTVLRTLHRKFDLIFLDPPYAGNLGELAIEAICDLDILNKNGIIVFEHGSEKKYSCSRSDLKTRTKAMGHVTVEFIRKKTVALFTGSFDPITKGHEALIEEALRRYDAVVVACLVNPDKQYRFTPQQRLALVNAVIGDKQGARALFSEKDAVVVAREVGADVLLRGIRSEDDLTYEAAMRDYNIRQGFDTDFIQIEAYNDVSSTTVKEQMENGDFRNLPAAALTIIETWQNTRK